MKILRTWRQIEKKIVVLFSTNYSRVLVNPPGHRFYQKRDNAVYDPYIRNLSGVPMQYWKKDGDKVVIMSDAEKVTRDLDIKLNGIDREFDPMRRKLIKRRRALMYRVALLLAVMNLLGALYIISNHIYG